MKPDLKKARSCRGFTAVEIAGTLVIIVLLCSVLAPTIYGIIDDARLASDLKGIAELRKAVEEYYRVKGTFAWTNGSVLNWSNNACEYWDREVLFKERFLDRTFQAKLGSSSYIRLVRVTAASGTGVATAGNVGHLGSFNCNNGLYDLTSEYSVNSMPDSRVDAYALARPAGPPPAVFGWRQWTDTLAALPVMACYALPTGTDPPPPIPGGGTAPSDPQYTGFDPYSTRTCFAAADANNPVIVAEVVIEGCRVGDAYRLSAAMEGFTQSIWAYYDVLGRVKYDMYNSQGPTKTGAVFIYLGRVPPR